MRKKTTGKILMGIAAMFAAVSLLACGNKQDSETDITPTMAENGGVTPTEAAVQREVVPAWTDYLTEDDIATASPWKSADASSLAAAMKKAEAGEPVTVACIGGSITQGSISVGTRDSEIAERHCYADIFFAWWKKTFPNSSITAINAGIGGTDSYLGVHRVQQDVLDYHPDIVLVEYSVNDGDNITYKKSYDNLLRRILLSEDQPAVLLLFMAQTNRTSAQNTHALVGFNYELPMISYKNLMEDLFDTGRFTIEELSGDESHPSVLGHAIVGEMIWKYLNDIYADVDSYGEPQPFDKKALTKESYLDSELLGSADITPEELGTFFNRDTMNGWDGVWTTTEGNGEIKFKVTCKNLGILFYRTTSAEMGTYEVYVDGEWKGNLNAYFKEGWGSYAYSQEVYTSNEAAEHEVVIKKAENSEGDDFTLLRLMISH